MNERLDTRDKNYRKRVCYSKAVSNCYSVLLREIGFVLTHTLSSRTFEIIDLSFLTSLAERAIVYFCFDIVKSNSLIFNYKDTKNIQDMQVKCLIIRLLTVFFLCLFYSVILIQNRWFTQLLDFTDY